METDGVVEEAELALRWAEVNRMLACIAEEWRILAIEGARLHEVITRLLSVLSSSGGED